MSSDQLGQSLRTLRSVWLSDKEQSWRMLDFADLKEMVLSVVAMTLDPPYQEGTTSLKWWENFSPIGIFDRK